MPFTVALLGVCPSRIFTEAVPFTRIEHQDVLGVSSCLGQVNFLNIASMLVLQIS